MSTPRRVRRAPLLDRLKDYLDPLDFLLWLSEEANSSEWQEAWAQWAIPGGIAVNLIYMIARANTGNGSSTAARDVFGDYHERRGTGWLAFFASFVVHLLGLLCILNAIYTFTRKRHYRLFEQSIDTDITSPSAHRVKVDSSPIASSPLRYLSNILHVPTAASSAHPDATRDVWEFAVWDPTPLCLRLFTLFSPGHILVYWLFLPLRPSDPCPSITVATTIFLAILITAQLHLLQTFSSQQAKDAALIHKEVQHEYDAKFVHPNLNRPVRDAGTQIIPPKYASAIPAVTVSTPVTYVNRGFKTSPNPNYIPHLDMNKLHGFGLGGNGAAPARDVGLQRSVTTPSFHSTGISQSKGTDAPDSSPLRPTPTPAFRPPTRTVPSYSSTGTGDGGSLGVYSHAQSPLRKTASANFGKQRERERSPEKRAREGSPLKRVSMPGSAHASEAVGFHVRSRGHSKGDGHRRETGRF